MHFSSSCECQNFLGPQAIRPTDTDSPLWQLTEHDVYH